MSDEITPENVDLLMGEGDADAPTVEGRAVAAIARQEVTREAQATALTERGADIQDTGALVKMAGWIYSNGVAPSSYKSVQQVAIGLLRVRELGLPPAAGLGQTYIVNNRVCLWGQAAIALISRSGQLADFAMRFEGEGDDRVCFVTVTRYDKFDKPMTPHERSFSMREAKTAGLTGKGPWKSYPDDMIAWRAKHRAFGDVFPDLLIGIDWAVNTAAGTEVIGGAPVEAVSGNDRLGEVLGDRPLEAGE